MARQRLTTAEAANVLGISPDAVRKRASRGQLESDKDPDGKLYIWLDTDTPERDGDDHRERLIEVLQEQLEHEREVNRENRRIIAGLVQRLPVIEESPSEPRETPVSAFDEHGNGRVPPEQEDQERPPWWRRFFGLE